MRIAFFISLAGLFLVSSLLSGKDSSAPRQRTEAEWEQALAPYIARVQEAFPAVVKRFVESRDEKVPPGLMLITRRKNAEGKRFEIMLRLEEVTPTGIYYGIVLRKQPEGSPVKEGDRIGIVASEVYDWAMREGRKPIEGFFVKRARNALATGLMAVSFDLQSNAKGRLIHAELSSVILPLTGDEITDIAPPHVEEDGREYLIAYYKTNKVPERFAQVSLFYTFPDGKRIEDPVKAGDE